MTRNGALRLAISTTSKHANTLLVAPKRVLSVP
jgi:hypothetical protein